MNNSEKVIYVILFCFAVIAACITEPAYARYDPEIRWRIIRTKNFTIYYPEGHELFAERVVSLTDEVSGDVAGYFGVSPRHLPIVLHPQTDVLNGFYSPFPNRISLFETPEHDLKWFGSTTGDIVDAVFTHEYGHFVHITTSRGLFDILAWVFGDGLRVTNAFSPGWAIEGITTNLETKFTDGGRGRSAYFRGMMRSFNGGSTLWGLPAAGTSSPYAPPSGRIYLSGYYMVEYLNRTYGDDAFARLSLYQAKHPVRGTGRALRTVTEKSPGTFYREFLDDFAARSDSIQSAASECGLSAGKSLTRSPLSGYASHFWTDRGTVTALRYGYDQSSALVEINPETGELIRETVTGRMFNFTPVRRLPDGRLLFGEVFFHPLGEGELDVSDLVVFDPASKQHERLTRNAHIYSADVSPDGMRYAAVRRSGMWAELVVMDRDGTSMKPLFSNPGAYLSSPAWAPDGKTIAVTVNIRGRADIALIDAETGNVRTLFASDTQGDGDPAFSPDGRWIVFASDREDNTWNIYAWDMRNRRCYRLTSVFTGAFEPRVSPDGGYLSFLVLEHGIKQVHILPFAPEAGKPVDVGSGSALPEPDLDRVQPAVSIRSRNIPFREAYKPFLHVPYWAEDRDGSALGALLMGSDPVGLNAYEAAFFYGTGSDRPGYHVAVHNRSFWPTVSFTAYDFSRLEDTLTGDENEWFREQGGELSLSLNVLHRTVPDLVSSSFSVGSRLRRFGDRETSSFDTNSDRAFSIFGDLSLMRIPDSAPRDMVPVWGQSMYLKREEEIAALGGEITGHNMVFLIQQYAPSPITHHGFEFTLARQSQRGKLYFANSGCIPRGYSISDDAGGLNLRNTLMLSLDYRFPLLFVDRGMGVNLVHVQLVRGSVFADQGAGWMNGFDIRDWGHRAHTAIGATLTAQTQVFSIVPLEIGVMAGYKPRVDDGFVNVVVDLWGMSAAAREKVRERFFFIPVR